MTEEKILQQAEIEALLKANEQNQLLDNNDDHDQGMLDQAQIDAMLKGSQGQEDGAMVNAGGEMSQADIDAMLAGGAPSSGGEMSQADIDAMMLGVDPNTANPQTPEQPRAAQDLPEELSDTERDALGEVGNISMGSAATALSQLLNRRVDITSPKIKIIPQQDFVDSFKSPFLVIQVQFTDGFEGHNVLVIKLHDAKVMADLMMGGDGTGLSDDISEIEISAAAEAMNQMIGTSSTALADLMGRSINIAPPEVVVVQELEKPNVSLPFDNPLVIISFDLIIKDLVDTSIMQVLDISNARAQARALLGSFGLIDDFDEFVATETNATAITDATPNISETSQFTPPVPKKASAGITAPSPVPATPAKAIPAPPTESLQAGMAQVDAQKLSLLLDIPLKVSVVLGRTKKTIKEVLSMTPGAIAELETLVEEPVDVLVNGKLVAKGEVVVVNENFGVKITSIISTTERIYSLGK